MKLAGWIGLGIAPVILRIRGLSALKNLFPLITGDSKMSLCPNGEDPRPVAGLDGIYSLKRLAEGW